MKHYDEGPVSIFRLRFTTAQHLVLDAESKPRLSEFNGQRISPNGARINLTATLVGSEATDWLKVEPGLFAVRLAVLENEDIIYSLVGDLETGIVRTPSDSFELFNPLGVLRKGTKGPFAMLGSMYRAVFRIEGYPLTDLFTSVGYGVHPDDDLKCVCERNQFTGIEFESVWSGFLESLY